MLSTYNEEHLLEKAKALGVAGYLLKTANKEDLLQTVRLVAGGQTCFPYRKPEVKNEFNSYDSFLKQYSLTKREWEVLNLIKEGYTNPQIAQQLYLSQHTVDSHRKNIMQKLGVHSTAALFKFMANHS
jgi:DNA-binding NarL/FixJ family response regulator